MTMSDREAAGLTCGHGKAAGPTFFKLWMPYLFQRVAHPKRKRAFLPLNRDYVPLGMTRGGWIDYEKVMPTHGVFFARDPAALDVWWNTRDEKLWLYDDSVASRLTYFARLEKLMLRQVEVIQ
ncbi:hypothetical protein ACFSGX_11280 [Sphingomonas arantia]|uniref:Uncharacterized protein n=1 Tax=Sphingomonas arantia TaxID=1460676 RepID=A0ABW4TXC0_9SPHN